MTITKKTRKILEYLVFRAALATVPHLPRKAVLRLASLLGALAYGLAFKERRIGMENLDIAFGHERSKDELTRILKESFKNLMLIFLDFFWFTKHTEQRVHDYVDPGKTPDYVGNDTGTLCITAHLGNWEILGLIGGHLGVPLTSVYAPLANPYVDKVYNRIRVSEGQKIIPRKGAVKSILRSLREGEKVAVALDQNTKPTEGGIFIKLFGRSASVSAVAASLTLRTGVPSIMAFGIPFPDGHYKVIIEPLPPFKAPKGTKREDAIQASTQQIANYFEGVIKAHPASWLWMYKRWKYIPKGEDAKDYPSYARRWEEG